VDAVLLALLGAQVIPEAALADGERQVGLLGPALDLAEDLVSQRLLSGCAGVGVRVLGREIGDRVRVVLLGQPRVRVDDRVAVVGALGGHALGDRRRHWCRHAPSLVPPLTIATIMKLGA
jgi:hypothetical protein